MTTVGTIINIHKALVIPVVLEIGFDAKRRKGTVDFRPHLPLVFQL